MNSVEVKELLFSLGADLCGIASAESLTSAPKGFGAKDVLWGCKSVIVFAKKFLAGTLACENIVPYTIVRNTLSSKLDDIAVEFCNRLESEGIIAVPTGTIGPTIYDERTGRYRNIVSSKHCAVAAGLGVIGKNTLLITPEYGNMVWLSTILCEAELEADKPLDLDYCKGCTICEKVCPAHAIGGEEFNQLACSDYAFNRPDQSEWHIRCFKCRQYCPHHFGTVNGNMER